MFVTIFFSIRSVNDNKNIVYLETETVKMLQNDTYVISPDDSRLKDNKMIYRSSDEKIAEITKDGKIISKNEGTTEIVVINKKNKYAKKYQIEVIKEKVENLAFVEENITASIGEEIKPNMSINGYIDVSSNVTFESSNESVVKIDKEGNLVAVGAGEAIIVGKKSENQIADVLVVTIGQLNSAPAPSKPTTTNNVLTNPGVSIDFANNLLCVRHGYNIYVYDLPTFSNSSKPLYSFSIYDNFIKTSGLQGEAISDGYIYLYYGQTNANFYIQTYNLNGKLINNKTFNPGLNSQEGEGIKVYNGKVFVGATNKEYEGTANTAKSGYNFQIGYFKD